jgi:site-specific DNA-methyltransferase (adenine-specific)
LSQSFHDGRVILHAGDCLAVLDELAEGSVDSVVTDPPYHLTSIVKRFGGAGAAPAQEGTDGLYARASRGFMGKQWDGGDIAFRVELWARILRVLKPGGHVFAFSGTRTYHRMAVAIEDAGFEIRDQFGWAYGSGFPKLHDVSKGIDRAAGAVRAVHDIRGGGLMEASQGEQREKSEYAETAPATDDAQKWEGWGTAVKPAWEPICLARKPLAEKSVAANVLAHGVGGINIDACRIEGVGNKTFERSAGDRSRENYRTGTTVGSATETSLGRWPANFCHDGSDEVLACFPESGGQLAPISSTAPSAKTSNVYGKMSRAGEASAERRYAEDGATNFAALPGARRSDSGSAARFFYSAKADGEDRLGSKHPTVKPVDLMRWLVRMVTPPGGVVLDPFAGTGTTGAAAFYEGFSAVLIEREEEYRADIARRMELLLASRRELRVAAQKAAPAGAGPLFDDGRLAVAAPVLAGGGQ